MQAIRSSSEFKGLGGPPGDPGTARTRRPKRDRSISARIRALLGAFTLALLATAALASSASAALSKTGPINPANQFPTWYADGDGLALEMCLTGAPNCLAGPGTDIPADLPAFHAAGGDAEAFYYTADATVGPANAHIALEAAYAAPGDGQQMT